MKVFRFNADVPRENKEPDWEALDTEFDPTEDDLVIENRLFAVIFHWAMVILLLSIVLVVVVGLFWLLLNHRDSPDFTHAKSEGAAWAQFICGGFLGVGGVILFYFEPF